MDSRLRNFFFDIRMWDPNKGEQKQWVREFRPYVTGVTISSRLGECWEFTVKIKSHLNKVLKFLMDDWCRFGNLMSIKFGYLNTFGKILHIGNRDWVSHWFTGSLVMPQVSLGEISTLDLKVVGVGAESGLLLQRLSIEQNDLLKNKDEVVKIIAQKNNFEWEFGRNITGLNTPMPAKNNLQELCDMFILEDIAKSVNGVVSILPSKKMEKMGKIAIVSPQADNSDADVECYTGFFRKADLDDPKPLLVMSRFESTSPIWFYDRSINIDKQIIVSDTETKGIKKVTGTSENSTLNTLKLQNRELTEVIGAGSVDTAKIKMAEYLDEGLASFGINCDYAPGVPWLMPGMKIYVKGFGPLYDDEYTISAVEHEVGDGGISTSIETWRSAIRKIIIGSQENK